jgi:hypothetical protein
LTRGEAQQSNKNGLLREPKYAGQKNGKGEVKSQYDVVITQALGREGTDWCPCSRLHVTYPEGSITLAVQTLGRLLRRYDGKTKAVARYYYPAFKEPTKGATKAELLDDRKNALLMLCQCEEMFYPILFPNLPRDAGNSTQHGHHMGSLEELLGTQAYIALKNDFISQAIEQGIAGGTSAELELLIDEILDDYDVDEAYHEDAHDTLVTMWLRAAHPMFRGISIDFVRKAGFPSLFAKLNDADKTLAFKHGYTKMKRLRAIIAKAWDEKFSEVSTSLKKALKNGMSAAAFWEKPENRMFKSWALETKAMAAKAGIC